ncbi:activating signal cointegrator 1 isoform X2 [Oryza brachyantha]|uniref:activating signal cointegrator 1 isoform X2 n=1 Tax=Oryza brachyantha TaxID=4533 RepID=UPI0003EA9DFE|nr:activating signal cointegrator 1 isoform X2 [Oryza brachyantha]
MSSGGGERLRNPCLTMHQPWASLLVHGIKRIEGRSWPSPVTGRLWIHAASKVPDPETIKAMEDFYREIYAVDGITDITFPQHYPVSRLLGCVEVVGCVSCQELASWEHVPQSVRLEALTDFCWLCENPQKLVVPFEMRGYQGVYNLERRIYEGAVRGLIPVQGPFPVNFPLPGSFQSDYAKPALEKSPSLTAAIAGARAAATQYSRKNHNNVAPTSTSTEETQQRFHWENHSYIMQNQSAEPRRSPRLQNGAPSRWH